MKLLFISAKDVNLKSNGGELCTNRNYLSFCELLGKENVSIFNIMEGVSFGLSNTINKRINYLCGFDEGLSQNRVNLIVELAKDFEYVFIDSSLQGGIAYHLRKKGYSGKIICFFHNVEYTIKLQKAKQKPWKLLEIFVSRYNEKKACRYADVIISLNKRDSERLRKLYRAANIFVVPISLPDRLKETTISVSTTVPPKFIFTGNNWYANLLGLDWFIKNVLDHVEIKLQITGYNMDVLKDKYIHPKIEFLGFVDDLAKVLMEADYVLLPIFVGSGMKVKTCEALMFGKNIIGTAESFEGYEVDSDKVGALCNTKEEFIESITSLCSVPREKFNKHSRKYFLEKYSYEATLNSFRHIIFLN
jgi:glycosyltransferase involved in cell wall biosynthesis